MIKETLLAKLVEKKLIKETTKIEADYIGVNEDGTMRPKKRTTFNVKSVTSTPLHPSLILNVVNTDDGSEAVIFSYDVLTIDGQKPQRFAVAKGVSADGIERLKKRRGRKPKIRDTQE
jgi:hypothetical protein